LPPQKKSGQDLPLTTLFGLILSTDGRRFAQMLRLHGHPPAALADVFHCCQFILANMGMVDTGRSAEAAIFLVAAGIA
jgi:hypothetical protein